MTAEKLLLKALRGQENDRPPVWFMRQAGRYLPEYRAVRAQAGGFLDLCYTPDLATEVTLQPIRRYGFDAAILFADILLVPQALGMDLWFVEGEGPRLALPDTVGDFDRLRAPDDVHETLDPIYQTVRQVRAALPDDTALIGFAGAPWTVATYMITGRGSPDQAVARRFMLTEPERFDRLIDRITDATVLYLSAQIDAGAEVVKLFDSWAGSLAGPWFDTFALAPAVRIAEALAERHPDVPVIGFPRGAGERLAAFADKSCFAGLALDTATDVAWAAAHIQPTVCVQGNLDPMLLVVGGEALGSETNRIRAALGRGPHVFNLGHGITPDADPDNVSRVLDLVRR